MSPQPIAFINARLVDPASGYDGPGGVLIESGQIGAVHHGNGLDAASPDLRVIDAGGAMLCPGLIDLRVKTGEPGSEPKETLKSAARVAG
jgi:dihydroorotase